jgi:ABC-2 type transport system permease protein
MAFRGSVQGMRAVGLAAFALMPTLIVAGIASAHPSSDTLAGSAPVLFELLTLPIVAMVIILVLSVAQFRNEIDAEILVYLSDRSVGRPTLVVGKYLGATVASLVFVLPSSLLPLAVTTLAGGTAYSVSVPAAVAIAAILATVAYGGFFLFLGLATRSALLVGLLFGFLWEELLPLLPGDVPRLTVIFYLRSFLSGAVSSGPLSGYGGAVPLTLALSVLVGIGVAFVVVSSAVLRYLETAPEKESA